jgi:glycosyltransferase involved in cell wall biosynthesis
MMPEPDRYVEHARQPERRPRVSVITPAYNAGRFLAECMTSVLGQTEQDVELLVVDDGSTDETAAVADRFQSEDPRVRVFHRENRGVSAARNLALAHARGTFIAFIDADDVWAPTFLAEQLAILERRPEIAVVTGNALFLGGGPSDGRAVRARPSQIQEIELLEMVSRDDAICIMSVFRREVYERIGGFDERGRYSEDFHFWFRAAAAGFRFVANPTPLGWYRRWEGSATSNEAGMLQGMIHVFRECRGLCEGIRPREMAAIDRQIARFQEQYVKCRAKRAMLEGDVVAAPALLDEWRRLRGGLRLHFIVLLWRLCPFVLLWAYRVKQASRAHRGKRLSYIRQHMTRTTEKG